MKTSKIKLVGIVALMVVLAFTMTACDSDSDNGTDPVEETYSAEFTVVDGNGDPVEGAVITVEEASTAAVDPVTTDVDGKATVTGLTADEYTYTIVAEDLGLKISGSFTKAQAEDGLADVDISEGETIEDQVIDSITAVNDTVTVSIGATVAEAVTALEENAVFEGVVADADNATLDVEWTESAAYDGEKIDEYTFTGTVTAPAGYEFAEDVDTEVEATVSVETIEVASVKAVTEEVYDNEYDQYLEAEILDADGNEVSLRNAKIAGYTFEFKTNKSVLDGGTSNTDGLVSGSSLSVDTFDYTVEISDTNGQVAKSDVQTVSVFNDENWETVNAEFTVNDVDVSTLAEDDGKVNLVPTSATKYDGTTTSSPVNWDGMIKSVEGTSGLELDNSDSVITMSAIGTNENAEVTVTLKGGATYTHEFATSTEARVPNTAVVDPSKITLTSYGAIHTNAVADAYEEQDVTITVTDNFGDPLTTPATIKLENMGDEDVFTTSDSITVPTASTISTTDVAIKREDGKTDPLTGHTMLIKNTEDTEIGSFTVDYVLPTKDETYTAEDVSYELRVDQNLSTSDDNVIDAYPANEDKSVKLRLVAILDGEVVAEATTHSGVNVTMGAIKLEDDTSVTSEEAFEISYAKGSDTKSVTPQAISSSAISDGKITIEAADNKTGNVTVNAKRADSVADTDASFDLEIVDNTPYLDSIALKDNASVKLYADSSTTIGSIKTGQGTYALSDLITLNGDGVYSVAEKDSNEDGDNEYAVTAEADDPEDTVTVAGIEVRSSNGSVFSVNDSGTITAEGEVGDTANLVIRMGNENSTTPDSTLELPVTLEKKID